MSYRRYMQKSLSNESFDEGNTGATNHVSVTFNTLSDIDNYQLDIQKDIDVLATLSFNGLVEPSSLTKAATESIYWRPEFKVSNEEQASTPSANTPSANSSSGNNSSNNSNTNTSNNNSNNQNQSSSEQRKAEQEQAKQKRENESKVKSFLRMVADAVKKIFAKIFEVFKALGRFLGIISKDSEELANKLATEEGRSEFADIVVANTIKEAEAAYPDADAKPEDFGEESGELTEEEKKKKQFSIGRKLFNVLKGNNRANYENEKLYGRKKNIIQSLREGNFDPKFLASARLWGSDYASNFKEGLRNSILGNTALLQLSGHSQHLRHFTVADFGGHAFLSDPSKIKTYFNVATSYVNFLTKVVTEVDYKWVFDKMKTRIQKDVGSKTDLNDKMGTLQHLLGVADGNKNGYSQSGITFTVKNAVVSEIVKMIDGSGIIEGNKSYRIHPDYLLKGNGDQLYLFRDNDKGVKNSQFTLKQMLGPNINANKETEGTIGLIRKGIRKYTPGSGNIGFPAKPVSDWQMMLAHIADHSHTLEQAKNNLISKMNAFPSRLIPDVNRVSADVESIFTDMNLKEAVDSRNIDTSKISKDIIEVFKMISTEFAEMASEIARMVKIYADHLNQIREGVEKTMNAALAKHGARG